MRRKVNFYIDGFNFYHRLRDMLDSALGLDYRWLDYRALCQSLLKPGEVLGDVFFFTAIPRHFLASETKNLLVLSLLRRHACLTTPVGKTHAPATAPSPTAKESPKPKPPRAVSPEAACVPDHSRGQAMPPQRLPVQPQKNPPNQNLLVPSLLRRHACLTTPVVKPCPRNGSQSNRKRIPQTKTSSCRLS